MKNWMKRLLDRMKNHHLSAFSAQIAYFFTLSIFPFFIVLFTLIGRLDVSSNQLIGLIERAFPPSTTRVLLNFIQDYITVEGSGVLSVSLLFTLFSASRAIHTLQSAVNNVHEIEETRNFIIQRLLGVAYTFGLVVTIILALALPNMGERFFSFIGRFVNLTEEFLFLFNILKFFLPAATFVFIIGSLQLFLPNQKLSLHTAWPGIGFSVIGWIILTFAFKFFITTFSNISVVYGSLAAMIILMMWLYFSGYVLLIGAEIVAMRFEGQKK
jgi:membrane protein